MPLLKISIDPLDGKPFFGRKRTVFVDNKETRKAHLDEMSKNISPDKGADAFRSIGRSQNDLRFP